MYAGTVIGGGKDLTASETACMTNTGGAWFDPKGEDIVVKLSGLTVGKTYAVNLTTQEDLSFYVTTGCQPLMGEAVGCLNFTDESLRSESGEFTATATEHFLVIDGADDPAPPTTGMFTASVVLAECTGDDARDAGAGNDTKATASMIAAPTVGTPTIVMGAVCNSPSSEADWYKVDLTADVGIDLAFTGATNDLDVYLIDDANNVVVRGESDPGINEAIKSTNIAAGTYYIVVVQYMPAGNMAAVPYTLKVQLAECKTDFQCLSAASPVCSGSGLCGAGPALCVSDDASEATGDDGPAGARDLTAAVGVANPLTGSICSSPGTEADYFKVVVADGQGITLSVAWTGATVDLDPRILDATGTTMGFSFYTNPENIRVTYLPAGTYYVRLVNFAATADQTTVVVPYTITSTITAAQTCATSTDCAAEYSTQLYRGQCVTATGTCQTIPAGTRANGMACDTGDDCVSKRCSYISFDADAQDSVCIPTSCAAEADCTAISATLHCTTGISTNFCMPACASNLECGANTGSDVLDSGQPWDYLTCTTATGVCSL
jgi:hypothetical protein